MKKTAPGRLLSVLGAALVLVVSFVPRAFAAPGATGASFLKFTPSPRATGMGESHVSVVGDAYSTYWNPAGLAAVAVPELAATYNSSFEDVETQYVAAAWPLESGSTLGFGFTRLAVSPFQGYDSIGVRTKMVDSSAFSAGLSYGRVIYKDEIARPLLSAGAGLKYIGARLDNVSAGAFAADFGAVYTIRPASYWLKNIPAQEFRIALAARNIGTGLKYDKDSTPLPASVSLGASWQGHPRGDSSLIVSLDNIVQKGDGYFLALGTEFTAFQLLSLRAGFRTGQDIGSGIRAGVGFHISSIDLDYSMSPFGDLGNMHKFGLSMKFGSPKAPQAGAGRAVTGKLIAPKEKIEQLGTFAQDYLALAKKDIAERRYAPAMKNIGLAFNLDPALKGGEWGSREKRLGEIVNGLKLAEIPDKEKPLAARAEQPDTAADAISAYLEGAGLKSLLLAQAARGADIRGPAVFEELLTLISSLVNIPVRREEILPRAAMVALKLETAEKAFTSRDFKSAVHECEEALLLEEGNKLGWKRLGSAYFALGDTAGARRAYEKVLKLDPEDASVLKFMELQNWSVAPTEP